MTPLIREIIDLHTVDFHGAPPIGTWRGYLMIIRRGPFEMVRRYILTLCDVCEECKRLEAEIELLKAKIESLT